MSRKIKFSLLLVALLCPALTLQVSGQSNVNLLPLVEANLVRNTGMIYLVVPGPLNGVAGQGKYFMVFYVGIVSPSNGVANHAHGMIIVSQSGGLYTVVPTLPYWDSSAGRVVMSYMSQPALSFGEANKIFFTRHDIENWYRSFNVALSMLPATVPEFQTVMGNNRNYEITLMSPRDLKELSQWDKLYGVEPVISDVVAVENLESLLSGILFVTSVLFGVSLWGVFIGSFEKGYV